MQVKDIPYNCRLLVKREEILNTIKIFNISPMLVGNIWISTDNNTIYVCVSCNINPYDQIGLYSIDEKKVK